MAEHVKKTATLEIVHGSEEGRDRFVRDAKSQVRRFFCALLRR